MPDSASFLSQQLLTALPTLADPNFSRTVTLICQHDGNGAMGIVLNRASELSVGDLFSQVDVEGGSDELRARPVLAGGPVHSERGFVLHDGDRDWDSSIRLSGGLTLTTSRDVLQAMASGEGPEHVLVALGCAGWGAGQLEQEIAENSWLTVDADPAVIFDTPVEQRYDRALALLGLEAWKLSPEAGHA